MTTVYIAPPPPGFGLAECDFVDRARARYELADDIVRTLDKLRKVSVATRRDYTKTIKLYLSEIEDFLWQALVRDYPEARYRRQGQTVVISYTNNSQVIYVNPGEVFKIKSWGHNEYYEALDTINRLQSQMYTNTLNLDRRWKDDWARLDKQLNTVKERECRGRPELRPGPIVITPPRCPPKPDPFVGCWPPLPPPQCPMWPLSDQRNWSVYGWSMGGSTIPGTVGTLVVNAPLIFNVDGRELVYYGGYGGGIGFKQKLVWLFHGAGGSARGWFTDYEKVKYIKKFLDAGYAVAAYDSYNRQSRKWAPTANPDTNRDIMGLKACQAFLAKLGVLREVSTSVRLVNPFTGAERFSVTTGYVGTMQYGVGMSNGGGFVPYAAGPMGLAKIAIHNAAGIESVIQNASYSTPTLWMVSAEDIVINNADANANYNYMTTNKPSVSVAYYTQQGTKMTSAIFDDIPSVSTVVAEAIITGLYAGGFINSNGTLTNKYSSAQIAIRDQYLKNTIPAIVSTAFGNDQATYVKYANDIIDQIKIAFSDHEFSGWQRVESGGSLVLTDRDLAFFNA